MRRWHGGAVKLSELSGLPLTYTEVGATARDLPAGYRHVRLSHRIGTGRPRFEEAAAAVLRYGMLRGAGLRVTATSEVAEVGADVLGRLGPFVAAPMPGGLRAGRKTGGGSPTAACPGTRCPARSSSGCATSPRGRGLRRGGGVLPAGDVVEPAGGAGGGAGPEGRHRALPDVGVAAASAVVPHQVRREWDHELPGFGITAIALPVGFSRVFDPQIGVGMGAGGRCGGRRAHRPTRRVAPAQWLVRCGACAVAGGVDDVGSAAEQSRYLLAVGDLFRSGEEIRVFRLKPRALWTPAAAKSARQLRRLQPSRVPAVDVHGGIRVARQGRDGSEGGPIAPRAAVPTGSTSFSASGSRTPTGASPSPTVTCVIHSRYCSPVVRPPPHSRRNHGAGSHTASATASGSPTARPGRIRKPPRRHHSVQRH